MDNYYERFPWISQDMSAEAILRALNEKAAGIANRFDAKSLETQSLIEEAKKVFRDEESKRAYDQALAESGHPKEDPLQKQREELEEWKQRAKGYYDEKEYDMAKMAIERALRTAEGLNSSDSGLYYLAATIYDMSREFGNAIRCINEAILLRPDHIGCAIYKGLIYSNQAWNLAKDRRFESSPELREEYKELRAKELTQLEKTCDRAAHTAMEAKALDPLAWTLYFRPNQVDEAQAALDRRQGLECARKLRDAQAEGGYFQKILARASKADELIKTARRHHDNKEYAQAKEAIEEALKYDTGEEGAYVYRLAASIYYEGDIDSDAALRYIEKAEKAKHASQYIKTVKALKGLIYGDKAVDCASAGSSQEYKELRAKELALLNDALKSTGDSADRSYLDNAYRVYILDGLAWTLYFRSDELDSDRASREKRQGFLYAWESRKLRRQIKEYFEKNEMTFFGETINRSQEILDEYENEKKQARKLYDSENYALAKVHVLTALNLNPENPYLNWLAASIYYNGGIDEDAALRYINKALEAEPENVYDLVLKGIICGDKALEAAKDSSFRSSSELQGVYRRFRTEELAAMKDARAKAGSDSSKLAYATGMLAWAEYFRPDAIDSAQAGKDRAAGIGHARDAERARPGGSKEALKVLEAAKKDLKEWQERAQSHYDKREYAQAKNAILQALSREAAGPSVSLYDLAARIYLENNELNSALWYIDKALALNPKAFYCTGTKGEIYGRQAERIQQNQRPQIDEHWHDKSIKISPKLQEEYRGLLAKELALMERAVELAKESGDREKQAYALGYLAWVTFFRFDITKEGRRPPEDHRRAVSLACQALELGKSWRAQEVLDADKEIQKVVDEMKRSYARDLAEYEALEKEYKKQMRRSFWDRFF